MADILVVDDEKKICRLLTAQLNDAGHKAKSTSNPLEATELVKSESFDIVLTDLRMHQLDGIELLKKIKTTSPTIDVIVMTAYASVETAIKAMKEGAYDYIMKPFKTEELLMLISRLEEKRSLEDVNQELRSYLAKDVGAKIIGSSPPIQRVKKLIIDLRNSEATVLIRGESGTGKELVAHAIHSNSRRANGPFIALNCAAIPEGLLESELFGYEKGAFTGASKRKLGHFQLADGGTLFLDEIGDLSLSLQAKLLRVLENRTVCPLGSEKERKVNIRLISATNRPLEEEMKRGTFREDLYYRLNVFPISPPPLRDCKEDIKELAAHFLALAGRKPSDLSEEAVRKMLSYNWPGNIRELRSVIERAVILKPQGVIRGEHILLTSTMEEIIHEETEELGLEEMEKRMIIKALRITGGNKSEAARLLGITRRALYGRLEKYDIE